MSQFSCWQTKLMKSVSNKLVILRVINSLTLKLALKKFQKIWEIKHQRDKKMLQVYQRRILLHLVYGLKMNFLNLSEKLLSQRDYRAFLLSSSVKFLHQWELLCKWWIKEVNNLIRSTKTTLLRLILNIQLLLNWTNSERRTLRRLQQFPDKCLITSSLKLVFPTICKRALREI